MFARMAELADARDLKSLARKGVWVRAPLRVPFEGAKAVFYHEAHYKHLECQSRNQILNFECSI